MHSLIQALDRPIAHFHALPLDHAHQVHLHDRQVHLLRLAIQLHAQVLPITYKAGG